MVRAAGGDPGRLHGAGTTELVLESPEAGVVVATDAWHLGRAAFVLGAGRRHAEDPVDHGVGLWMMVSPGDPIERGQPWVRIAHRDGRGLEEAVALCKRALVVGASTVVAPLVHDTIAS
jgi:thymidine phosphorylase